MIGSLGVKNVGLLLASSWRAHRRARRREGQIVNAGQEHQAAPSACISRSAGALRDHRRRSSVGVFVAAFQHFPPDAFCDHDVGPAPAVALPTLSFARYPLGRRFSAVFASLPIRIVFAGSQLGRRTACGNRRSGAAIPCCDQLQCHASRLLDLERPYQGLTTPGSACRRGTQR
jgi:hypothetical protein